jgi:hypothetical protein
VSVTFRRGSPEWIEHLTKVMTRPTVEEQESALRTMLALAGSIPRMIGVHDDGGLLRYDIAPPEYQ